MDHKGLNPLEKVYKQMWKRKLIIINSLWDTMRQIDIALDCFIKKNHNSGTYVERRLVR